MLANNLKELNLKSNTIKALLYYNEIIITIGELRTINLENVKGLGVKTIEKINNVITSFDESKKNR